MRSLDAEPGIVVVDASRDWGTWHVAGMRDPMARDPAAVLAAAGFPSVKLAGKWDPYLALDSAMVVARAARSLGTGPGVRVALRGDTLVLSGSASLDWVARARAATLQAGAQHLDLTQLQTSLPPTLDSLRSGIDSVLVLFDAGSSQLSAASATQLRSVARRFTLLNGGLAELGAGARLTIVGRTDTSGADATNRSLAQQRVDAATRVLLSLGVPSSLVSGRAVATDSPLVIADPSRQARANRSVAFRPTWTAPFVRSAQ
jgi:OOP family OmpA-OmpF porin